MTIDDGGYSLANFWLWIVSIVVGFSLENYTFPFLRGRKEKNKRNGTKKWMDVWRMLFIMYVLTHTTIRTKLLLKTAIVFQPPKLINVVN